MAKTELPTIEDELAIKDLALLADEFQTGILPQRLPPRSLPFLFMASGLYTWKQSVGNRPVPQPLPIRPLTAVEEGLEEDIETELGEGESELRIPFFFRREELRLDVDGRYPQMTASGSLFGGFSTRVHWIAALRKISRDNWTGRIWYKDGNATVFPYTAVRISVTRSIFPNQRQATVTYIGSGLPMRTQTFRYASPYFHKVNLEYDAEDGVTPELSVNTGAHSNRPAILPVENLSVDNVFRRAGFQVSGNPTISSIPADGPDANATWSDAEMHDAMQTYWSRFDNRPQWALWTLFAKQHDMGSGLGGIMFDDIGPNHRQGTAIFYDSFISQAPAGEPEPTAYVDRMRFWTAVHEMGHAFNLAHSWQKNLGTPWIPLTAEPEARSFMNYPYRVEGGQAAFFADFEYSFSDNELLFMRHAPARFVQMGNADWFDHHGFQEAEVEGVADFALEIGIDRDKPSFEFLEPVVIELKATNISGEPRLLTLDFLRNTEHLVVILKKDGKTARQWAPFAVRCEGGEKIIIQPGEAVSESLFISTGLNGWDLAEPGLYTVQLALEVDGVDIISNPLRLRVAPPTSREEESIAQDILTDDAARVMAFHGSQVLTAGIEAWQELVHRLPESRAAIHARIALGLPLTRDYRLLRVDAPTGALAIGGQGAFTVTGKKVDEGHDLLNLALIANPKVAAETLGRKHFEAYCGSYARFLTDAGKEEEAKKVGATMRKIVAAVGEHHYPAVRVAA